ncbi:MAG: TraB/GumN family protein [Candidatus Kapaibacterium sp.]
MMIYRRTALILAWLLHAAPSALSTVPTGDQSLFWRITAPSGVVSHIFGTIHLADTTVFHQRDTVLQVLDASSAFAAELNLDSAFSQMKPQVLMLTSGTLYDIYDSSSVQMLCAELEKVNPLFGRACPRMKPGAIMMLASMSAVERTAPSSIDEFLWARAKKNKTIRRGLETFAEQIDLIDSMPPAMVLKQIRRLDSAKIETEKLRDHYAREELDSLQTGEDDDVYTPELMATLNDRRNVRMAERMIPMLQTGNSFVAIGALHLTGPKSVISLLRERGYTVEPVIGGNRVDWLKWGSTEKRR